MLSTVNINGSSIQRNKTPDNVIREKRSKNVYGLTSKGKRAYMAVIARCSTTACSNIQIRQQETGLR
jgi:hypothetical protein